MEDLARQTDTIFCPLALRVCLHCDQCMCTHLAYEEPHFSKKAPVGFKLEGFQQQFLRWGYAFNFLDGPSSREQLDFDSPLPTPY
jgi:hypothetical protein